MSQESRFPVGAGAVWSGVGTLASPSSPGCSLDGARSHRFPHLPKKPTGESLNHPLWLVVGSRIALSSKPDHSESLCKRISWMVAHTIIKRQAMNVLTTTEQAVIFITSLSSGEYLCILRARYHQLYGYTHLHAIFTKSWSVPRARAE